MILEWNGRNVRMEKKRIRNLHIYVKPPYGDILVTAPLRMSNRDIRRFLDEKNDWILRNVEKFESNPVTPDPDLQTGDIIAVWGTYYQLRVTEGTRYKLELPPGLPAEDSAEFPTAELTVRKGSSKEQRTDFLNRWYREQLEERVAILLPKWEDYTGLHCSGYTFRRMKSEWGSCNVKTHRITFNTRLAEHPVECLEYIILHELAHTVVPNHGPEFKAIETRYMPDWKTVRKKLNGKL